MASNSYFDASSLYGQSDGTTVYDSSGNLVGSGGGNGSSNDSSSASMYEPFKKRAVDLSSVLIPNPIMYAERILNSPAINGRLTFPIQMHTTERTECIVTTVPLYLSNDFSLGTFSNKWENLWNMDFFNTVTQFTNGLASYTGQSQVSMQSHNMSAKVWSGSDYNGFSIDVLFVATRRTINPAKIIIELVSSALPSKLNRGDNTTAQGVDLVKNGVTSLVSGGGKFAKDINNALFQSETFNKYTDKTVDFINKNIDDVGLIAPLYYGLKMEDGVMVPLNNTTLTLDIGEYLTIDNLIVNSVSNVTFSKEIIAPPAQTTSSPNSLYDNRPKGDDEGYPLWAKCTLNLMPYALVTKKDFQSWFHFKKSSVFKNPIGALGGTANVVDSHFELP